MTAAKCLVAVLFGIVSLSILGCQSDNDDDHKDKDEVKIERDRVDGVPKAATKVEEGSPGDLDFKADHNGTIYLYDVDARKLIYSGHIDRDERFRANAGRDEATIDGRTVLDRKLHNDHQYRLYFERD